MDDVSIMKFGRNLQIKNYIVMTIAYLSVHLIFNNNAFSLWVMAPVKIDEFRFGDLHQIEYVETCGGGGSWKFSLVCDEVESLRIF